MNPKIIKGEIMNKSSKKLLYILLGLVFVFCSSDILAHTDSVSSMEDHSESSGLDPCISMTFCDELEGNIFNKQFLDPFPSFEKNYNTIFLQDFQYRGYSSFSERSDFNVGIITGIWIPTGKIEILGNHPQFGFFMGGKRCRFEYSFSGVGRFLQAANEYTVKHEGILYDTTGYFGWYLGIDFGYEIFYRKSNGILLLAGMGWDAFRSEYIEEEETAVIRNSFNFNSGVGYRYYYRELESMSYIEFDFKYNFIDYKNRGGTDLAGNAVSILFIWGNIFY
jgi:hypothetical protein